MAFKVAQTIRNERGGQMASVSYSRPRGAAVRPRLIVGLPAAAVAGFKFRKDQKFAIAFGEGADAGRTRIVSGDDGVVLTEARGGGATLRFGYVPALGDDAAAKERTAYRVLDPKKDDGAILELTGPAWLRPVDDSGHDDDSESRAREKPSVDAKAANAKSSNSKRVTA